MMHMINGICDELAIDSLHSINLNDHSILRGADYEGETGIYIETTQCQTRQRWEIFLNLVLSVDHYLWQTRRHLEQDFLFYLILRKNRKRSFFVIRFTRFGRIVVISAPGVKSSFTGGLEPFPTTQPSSTWLLLKIIIISSQLRD